jgi:hypothetical protein
MAHFAKIEENIVVLVTAGRDEDNELELCSRTGDTYKRTSYNTYGGVHHNPRTGEPSEDQSKAFRKNYAGIGYRYDEEKDAFIAPSPLPSWVLNEDTCLWDPPVAMPDDGKLYHWDEDTTSWIEND